MLTCKALGSNCGAAVTHNLVVTVNEDDDNLLTAEILKREW